MSHDNYFYEKKLFILLAPYNIFQKQKTESVYLIPKNNYGLYSEIGIFQSFSLPPQQKKMMTSSKIWRHFELFYETKNICCMSSLKSIAFVVGILGRGGGVNLHPHPPPPPIFECPQNARNFILRPSEDFRFS